MDGISNNDVFNTHQLPFLYDALEEEDHSLNFDPRPGSRSIPNNGEPSQVLHHPSQADRSRLNVWLDPNIDTQLSERTATKTSQYRTWQPPATVSTVRPHDRKSSPTLLKGLRDAALKARTYHQQVTELQNRYWILVEVIVNH